MTQPDGQRFIDRVVNARCSMIVKPYSLDEICEQIETDEYNPELMLQHLLLWVSAYVEVSGRPHLDTIKEN